MLELIAIALLLIAVLLLWQQNAGLRAGLAELRFAKQSQSVRYGRMSEQFMPFLKDYPYDSQQFRFLGTPVDGVQFNEDEIVFLEFKSGSSRLSDLQKRVRALIADKKVRFEERRIA